jgi:hypothetical protein
MKKLIALAFISILASCTVYEENKIYCTKYADFNDIALPQEGYLDANLGSSYKSNGVEFYSDWVSDFGGYSNGGIYPSNLNDQFTTGILNQYSVIAQNNNYNQFGVVHYSDYNAKLGNNLAKFKLPMATTVESIKVTNSTYAYWAIKTGDDGFGTCRAYKEGDWFKVTFTGYDVNGNKTGEIDHYLADFRGGKSYISTSWEEVSLIGLGDKVSTVEISIDGTDVGEYGLNTPTYCCINNILYRHMY